MKEQKNLKTNYSRNIIPITAMVLIIVGIILIVSLSNNIKKKTERNILTDSSNVEIEVRDNVGGDQFSNHGNIQGPSNSNQLGPSTVDEITRGSSSEEFYQTPNTEKMLEGKEIEVK